MFTHFTSLENGLNFMKPFLSKFMGLSPFQMQKDVFSNDLCTKFYNKLKPIII